MSPRDDEPRLDPSLASRLLSTGKLAGSAARLTGRRLFRREGPADARIGEALAAELDRMKGMAMKVGQILSYFEGILPEETHAALQTLQRGVTTMRPDQVANAIESEFGRPTLKLFDSFDPEPVAGASIGQVHRAVHDGRSVAVKIQYPGIRENIDADFRRLGGIGRLVSVGTAVDGRAITAELKERVDLECDYLHEAAAQEVFRAAFAEDTDVYIPEVVRERSGTTVITTEWADGSDFYTFARDASRERRDWAARVLLRFAYRSLYGLHNVNADPHPGNYLFPERGPIVFLDFGCVRSFDAEFMEAERELARVMVEDRRDGFDDAVIATGIVGSPDRFDFDLHWRMMCHYYAPFRSAEFEFTLGHIRQAMEFNGFNNPNGRRMSIQPQWIWQQRLQWGLHAVLARLGARGDFRSLMLEFLALEPKPLVIPEPGSGALGGA